MTLKICVHLQQHFGIVVVIPSSNSTSTSTSSCSSLAFTIGFTAWGLSPRLKHDEGVRLQAVGGVPPLLRPLLKLLPGEDVTLVSHALHKLYSLLFVLQKQQHQQQQQHQQHQQQQQQQQQQHKQQQQQQ